MNIKLSQGAYYLLKHVITTTGDKEIAPNGQEVNSPLRLNGEESAQRRHYLKLIDPLLEAKKVAVQGLIDKAKEEWKKDNEQGDKDAKVYDAEMNKAINTPELMKELNAISDEDIEVELTDKTIGVLKRYFVEFGDKNGWTTGDDKAVEEIENAFNQ